MKTKQVLAALSIEASDTSALSAFRIFRAGANEIDKLGTVYFTQRSADLLLAEQEARGRLYSFDFDHLSLKENRPADAGRAAGWHKIAALDTPNGPELWAVEIEWCADVKAGLEEKPPRWRYFSPAFICDEKTGEILSYTNCALCINPRTHKLQSLAAMSAEGETTKEQVKMDISKMLEIVKGLTVPSDQKEAIAAVVAALEKMQAGGEPSSSDVSSEEAADGSDDSDDKKEDKKDDDKKIEAALSGALKTIRDLQTQVASLTTARDSEIRASLFASHPGVTKEMRAALEGLPIAKVKAILASSKLETAALPTRTTQGKSVTASDGPISAEVDRAMGISVMAASDDNWIEGPDGRLILNTEKIKKAVK